MSEEIFRVEVNDEGLRWMHLFHGIAKWMLVITIGFNGLSLVTNLSYVLKASKNADLSNAVKLQNDLYIGFLVIEFIFQTVQIVLYLRFAAQAKKSAFAGDSQRFNQSFKWMFFQSLCFLVQILIAFAYFAYTYLVNHH